ncbi:hypothetical protein C8R43DRAFT_907802, partial [Mycena crocata]
AWSPSTREKYERELPHFLSFCDAERIPSASRLLASETLLCAFAASFTRTHDAAAVKNKLDAVRAWHIVNNACAYLAPPRSRRGSRMLHQ